MRPNVSVTPFQHPIDDLLTLTFKDRLTMDAPHIPILKIGEVLIASIQVALHHASAVQFKADLLERLHAIQSRQGTGTTIVCRKWRR